MGFAESFAKLPFSIKPFLHWIRAAASEPASQLLSLMKENVNSLKHPLDICILDDSDNTMMCELGMEQIWHVIRASLAFTVMLKGILGLANIFSSCFETAAI